jgi:uncharacterized protein YdeI (YjbR/CyaY-like superfamily)
MYDEPGRAITMTRTMANAMNPKVDAYLDRAGKWKEELKTLRKILLSRRLVEELKWGKPCYTFDKRNVVILIPMKESCALAFSKGVLLKDPKGILLAPGENSQAVRWIKFTNVSDIAELEPILNAYVDEAVEIEAAGLKVSFKQTSELTVPVELQVKLDELPALKSAFDALTPGRQRAYILHFSAPKQSKTRESRVEKCMPLILDGKGLNDR